MADSVNVDRMNGGRGQIVSYLPTKMLLSLRGFSDLGAVPPTSTFLSSDLCWLVGVCGVIVVTWA